MRAGREGYRRWRTDLARFHADTAAAILRDVGYGDDVVARVGSLLRKERLKADPDVQLLEDVICLVFIEHYLAGFAPKHDEETLAGVLRKTVAEDVGGGARRRPRPRPARRPARPRRARGGVARRLTRCRRHRRAAPGLRRLVPGHRPLPRLARKRLPLDGQGRWGSDWPGARVFPCRARARPAADTSLSPGDSALLVPRAGAGVTCQETPHGQGRAPAQSPAARLWR